VSRPRARGEGRLCRATHLLEDRGRQADRKDGTDEVTVRHTTRGSVNAVGALYVPGCVPGEASEPARAGPRDPTRFAKTPWQVWVGTLTSEHGPGLSSQRPRVQVPSTPPYLTRTSKGRWRAVPWSVRALCGGSVSPAGSPSFADRGHGARLPSRAAFRRCVAGLGLTSRQPLPGGILTPSSDGSRQELGSRGGHCAVGAWRRDGLWPGRCRRARRTVAWCDGLRDAIDSAYARRRQRP